MSGLVRRADSCIKPQGANRTPSAPLSAAAPHPQEGFPEARPVSFSQEGFPKGRAAARPFVSFQGGAGGNRNPPAFLFRGAGGDILFSKENIPFGFSPRKPGPPFAPKTPSPCPDMGMSPCGSKSSPVPHSGTFMKYPPDPKILLRFPRYGPSGPGGYPPAGGRTPPPSAPHPPA